MSEPNPGTVNKVHRTRPRLSRLEAKLIEQSWALEPSVVNMSTHQLGDHKHSQNWPDYKNAELWCHQPHALIDKPENLGWSCDAIEAPEVQAFFVNFFLSSQPYSSNFAVNFFSANLSSPACVFAWTALYRCPVLKSSKVQPGVRNLDVSLISSKMAQGP